jgi:hypothetical protein
LRSTRRKRDFAFFCDLATAHLQEVNLANDVPVVETPGRASNPSI